MKILIVSEEEQFQFMKQVFIREIEQIEIIEAKTALEAIKLAKRHDPDFIFLDIEQSSEDGLEITDFLQQLEGNINVILIGNDTKYAIDAFRLRAYYYLLKPVSEEEVAFVSNLIRKEYKQKSHASLRKLPIEMTEGIAYVAPSQIVYISKNKENKTVSIYMKEATHISTYTLQELEQKLTPYYFLRVHKSYLINLHYVKELRPYYNGTYNVYLSPLPDEPIPVSRNYIRILRNNLEI